MKLPLLLLVLSFCVCCATCKKEGKTHHTKPNSPTTAKKDSISPTSILFQGAKQADFQFQTLAISGKLSASIPNQTMMDGLSFSYRIHMMKDSMIWMKVTMLGFEGARALITPSKIMILDRQNNTARISSLKSIKKYIGFEVDFGTLQSLMLGRLPIAFTQKMIFEGNPSPSHWRFSQGNLKIDYNMEDNTPILKQLQAEQKPSLEKAILDYQNIKPLVSGQNFPHLLQGNVNISSNPSSFTLNHTKIEENPAELSFQFNIPEDFKIIQE